MCVGLYEVVEDHFILNSGFFSCYLLLLLFFLFIEHPPPFVFLLRTLLCFPLFPLFIMTCFTSSVPSWLTPSPNSG